MEQKVEETSGITPRQKQLLELIVQEPYIIQTFYFTGGTALTAFYLHHRRSYDLDFFSTGAFDYDYLLRFFRQLQDVIDATITSEQDYGFLEFFVRYPDNERVKVDFNHYSSMRIKNGFKWKNFTIDSMEDIATNKLEALASRPRARDYVDFYFLLQKNHFKLPKIIKNVIKKFRHDIDLIQLSKNFLKVSEYADLPKMLVPFDRKDMDTFYMKEALSLKQDIFT